jgi:hypothetical protein
LLDAAAALAGIAPRRHQAECGGYDSLGIHQDERLLRVCREAVAGG